VFGLFWIIAVKILLVGIWNGGLSDESEEDMVNLNLHVMRFLSLSLDDEVLVSTIILFEQDIRFFNCHQSLGQLLSTCLSEMTAIE